MDQSKKIIQVLNLKQHPEGGYFRETYRSDLQIDQGNLGENFSGKRNCSTCIYFLLTSNMFSAFHRIKQDEVWHFYQGSPIRLHTISPNGEYCTFIIGNNLDEGQVPQLVIPREHWFAAETINQNDYSLVGCTVSPGFDFDDFELGNRKGLISLFPQHRQIINEFTRD